MMKKGPRYGDVATVDEYNAYCEQHKGKTKIYAVVDWGDEEFDDYIAFFSTKEKAKEFIFEDGFYQEYTEEIVMETSDGFDIYFKNPEDTGEIDYYPYSDEPHISYNYAGSCISEIIID
jgi:capsule polysaccharide modification protein KpsS